MLTNPTREGAPSIGPVPEYAHLRIKFYWESEDHENDLD